MKYSTASPRRPAVTRSVKVFAVSAGGLGYPSGMNGGSHSASFVILAGTLRAASRARAAPEDEPYRHAAPPAVSAMAAMSSISRSTAYGGVSPLGPLPLRS